MLTPLRSLIPAAASAVILLILSAPAGAQQPQELDLEKLQQQLGLPAGSMSMSSDVERVWVSQAGGVVSKRFATDEDATHVTFDKDQPLRVLYREDGWVRVRDGNRYGWVPEEAVTDTSPKVTVPGMVPGMAPDGDAPIALPVPGAGSE